MLFVVSSADAIRGPRIIYLVQPHTLDEEPKPVGVSIFGVLHASVVLLVSLFSPLPNSAKREKFVRVGRRWKNAECTLFIRGARARKLLLCTYRRKRIFYKTRNAGAAFPLVAALAFRFIFTYSMYFIYVLYIWLSLAITFATFAFETFAYGSVKCTIASAYGCAMQFFTIASENQFARNPY